MTDLEKTGGKNLISLLHKGGGIEVQKPFERDIFLFSTYVAGTSHIEGILDLEPYLKVGDRLNFFREEDNPYDKNAIEVRNMDDIKIGYVPKKDNPVFARLMDAGKILFGKIIEKDLKEDRVYIKMDIYLND